MTAIENKHLLLKHPFTAVVAGPSGSGKTVLVREIIEDLDKMIYPKPALVPIKVLWAYGQWQDGYADPFLNQNVEVRYVDGLPDEDEKYDLLVVDDLMDE